MLSFQESNQAQAALELKATKQAKHLRAKAAQTKRHVRLV